MGAALADLNQALAIDRDFLLALMERGSLLEDTQQYSQAVDDYSRALRIDRGYAPGYLGRGYAHLTLGHQEQALADMSQALELSTNSAFKSNVRRAIREAQE